MKIGEDAMERGGHRQAPMSVRCVILDVIENPGSSVGEIVTRTGLPQSHVSATVARLRERGTFVVESDRADRRRTLVRLSPEVKRRFKDRSPTPIDASLREGLALDDEALREIIDMLQALSDRISPSVLARIRGKLDSGSESPASTEAA